MLDLDRARAVMLREVDSALARLEGAPDRDWARPVRCEGWTVRELGHHLAGGTFLLAESYRRALNGTVEPPAREFGPSAAPAEIVTALRDGRGELSEAVGALTPDALGTLVPLPFGTLPAAIALPATVLEVGVHRNDLEWALGNEEPLPHDVATSILELAAGMLPLFAASGGIKPEAPIAFRLLAPEQPLSLVFRDGTWQVGEEPSLAACEISGDASALSLFLLGRIPADHPSLKTSGQAALARRFKAYFPGP